MPQRAALVTGASKGIGAAIAKRLAMDGFDVVVHCNTDRAGAKRTATAVERLGRRAVVAQADLGHPDGVDALAQIARAAFPRLAAIVHNAGFYDRRSFAELDGAAWRDTLAVDLEAPALLTRALLPNLATGAAIVFISSVAAARGSAHGASYAAAKAGLEGLTRSLAQELAPSIRVNAVAPGFVDTDILAGDSKAKRQERVAQVPLGRIGSPPEVAGAVSFLVGPDASYVTGTVLAVNGGLRMG